MLNAWFPEGWYWGDGWEIAERKAIQHYGSDTSTEMAAVYLSVVSTVKLAGQSV